MTRKKIYGIAVLVFLILAAFVGMLSNVGPEVSVRDAEIMGQGKIGRGLNIDEVTRADTLTSAIDIVINTNGTSGTEIFYPVGYTGHTHGDAINALVSTAVVLNGSNSSNNMGGSIDYMKYIWGDGNSDVTYSTETNVSHTYSENGTYILCVYARYNSTGPGAYYYNNVSFNVYVWDVCLRGNLRMGTSTGARVLATAINETAARAQCLPSAIGDGTTTSGTRDVYPHYTTGADYDTAWQAKQIAALYYVQNNEQTNSTLIVNGTGVDYVVYSFFAPSVYLYVGGFTLNDDYYCDVIVSNATQHAGGGGTIYGPGMVITNMTSDPIWNTTYSFSTNFGIAYFGNEFNFVDASEQYRLLIDLYGANSAVYSSYYTWGDGQLTSSEATYALSVIDEDLVEHAFNHTPPDDTSDFLLIDGKSFDHVQDSTVGTSVTGYGYYNSSANLSVTFKTSYTNPTTGGINTSKTTHSVFFLMPGDTVWNKTARINAPTGWTADDADIRTGYTDPDYWVWEDSYVYGDASTTATWGDVSFNTASSSTGATSTTDDDSSASSSLLDLLTEYWWVVALVIVGAVLIKRGGKKGKK